MPTTERYKISHIRPEEVMAECKILLEQSKGYGFPQWLEDYLFPIFQKIAPNNYRFSTRPLILTNDLQVYEQSNRSEDELLIEIDFENRIVYILGFIIQLVTTPINHFIITHIPQILKTKTNMQYNNYNDIVPKIMECFETDIPNGTDIADLLDDEEWRGCIVSDTNKVTYYTEYYSNLKYGKYEMQDFSITHASNKMTQSNHFGRHHKSDNNFPYFVGHFVELWGYKELEKPLFANITKFFEIFKHIPTNEAGFDEFERCLVDKSHLNHVLNNIEPSFETNTISGRFENAFAKIEHLFRTGIPIRQKGFSDSYYTAKYLSDIHFDYNTTNKSIVLHYGSATVKVEKDGAITIIRLPDGDDYRDLERYSEFFGLCSNFGEIKTPQDVAKITNSTIWHDVFITDLKDICYDGDHLRIKVKGTEYYDYERPHTNAHDYTWYRLYSRYIKEHGIISEAKLHKKYKSSTFDRSRPYVSEEEEDDKYIDVNGYLNTIFFHKRFDEETYKKFSFLIDNPDEAFIIGEQVERINKIKREKAEKTRILNGLGSKEEKERYLKMSPEEQIQYIKELTQRKAELEQRKRDLDRYMNTQIYAYGKDMCVVCGGHIHNLGAITQAFPKNMFEGGTIESIGALCCSCHHAVFDMVRSGEEFDLQVIMDAHKEQREKALKIRADEKNGSQSGSASV